MTILLRYVLFYEGSDGDWDAKGAKTKKKKKTKTAKKSTAKSSSSSSSDSDSDSDSSNAKSEPANNQANNKDGKGSEPEEGMVKIIFNFSSISILYCFIPSLNCVI